MSADTLSTTSTSLVSAGFLATTRIIYGDLDETGPGILNLFTHKSKDKTVLTGTVFTHKTRS